MCRLAPRVLATAQVGVGCGFSRVSMPKRMAQVLLTLDTQGVSLTDFAQSICLHEALEVSVVRISLSVQQVTFPLCLIAASGLRPTEPLGPRDVPAWPLVQLPQALRECVSICPAAPPCGLLQTIRVSHRKVSYCTAPRRSFELGSTASC